MPFETVNIDFITKLPPANGYDSIMTIVDHDCTKAAVFLPCREQMDALKTAKLYATHVFPHYELPKKIISDRDVRFTSAFTKELCNCLKIQQNLSSAYHPQTDGLAEQTNQWVEQYLRIFGNELQNDWNEHLPIAQFVHNSWPHEVTKRTPFELLIGANPRMVIPGVTQKIPALEERQEYLERVRWVAQKAMVHAQALMKRAKGKRAFTPYQKDQKVWLEATHLKTMHPTTKLAPRRYGPFVVTKVISPVVYQLAIPKHWKIHDVFHTSLLTPYIETPTHGPNYEELPPELIDEQPEWEVDAILDSRRFGRTKTLQYRIRWKGYSAAHDSWEPATQVHAPDLVAKYYKSKGKTAIKSITPVSLRRIQMDSPISVSTPSYIRELTAQFEAQPLPDFNLLGDPLPDLVYPDHDPFPNILAISTPDDHPQLRHRMATPDHLRPEDHPGDNWELAATAVHTYTVLINDPTINETHEAKYLHFAIGKESNEPQIWGTDGLGHDIVASQLTAEPCFDNVNLGIDNSDLTPLSDFNMFTKETEDLLWELHDFGVLADVHRLQRKPVLQKELEKRHTMKNRIMDLADVLQRDYTEDLQEFLRKQQDVRRRLVRARVMTRMKRTRQGWQTPDGPDRERDSDSMRSLSIGATEANTWNPLHLSSSDGSVVRGQPLRHGLAWHVRANNNRCKFCEELRHFLKYCPNPHTTCRKENHRRCMVNLHHTSYGYTYEDCPFHGQRNAVLAERGVPGVLGMMVTPEGMRPFEREDPSDE